MDAKRVVIVDDEMVLGQLLQAAFATLSGHIEVTVVPSAEDAVLQLEKSETHLIVSDVKLPGISGLEFAKQTKKTSPNINIILVSGLNDPQLKEKAAAAGADAFYPKPVEMRDFLETASRLLGLSSQPARMSSRQVIDLRSDLLGDVLIGLRQELSAVAVLLADERGKILASAGDPMEDALSSKILPYLLSTANALQRINTVMTPETPQSMISVRGSQFDLVASPMPGYLLIVFMKHVRSTVRMAVAFDAVNTAVSDLMEKIGEINQEYPAQTTPEMEQAFAKTGPLVLPEPIQAASKGEKQEPEPPGQDFESIFTTVVKKKVKVEEVDSFWETATSNLSFSDSKEPGLLSFEEANQLGLTPKEGEETAIE